MSVQSFLRSIGPVMVLFLSLSGCKPPPDMSGLPNIVLICVDSTRPDHLGCYGYDRDTSPVIDSLASSGVLWTRCQSQSSWSMPAFTSLWTGTSPEAHRTGWFNNSMHPVDPILPTIASVLRNRGYTTAAFVSCYYLGEQFGFGRGFGTFAISGKDEDSSSGTVDKVITWLDKNLEESDRILLAVHLFDPHPPYDPPEPYRSMWTESDEDSLPIWWSVEVDSLTDPGQLETLVGMYDGEIRSSDHEIGRILTHLRTVGIADSTVVIILSDNGQEFLDHGWIGHSHSLYQELLHVPLIISGPGIPSGEQRDANVGLWDLLPTIVGLTDSEMPINVQGMDLLSDSLPPTRAIPSGFTLPDMYVVDDDGKNPLTSVKTVAVMMGDLKVIWDMVADSMVMYDLSIDPAELSPIPITEDMEQQIQLYVATPPQGTSRPMHDEILMDVDYGS